MSERYPAISQLIAENRIPEFDCLYLDMNGIIHNCTHKDSDSPTFRMTEDRMFIAIFNYIEHLFSKIKPKQLFFMAIDGVAPRAKMNQQRSRRFRTALDAEKAKEKAIKEGVQMPTEDAFDSNCITPGTEFMAKLTKQLKYFIHKKVSEDVDWQGVEIVLSGHEVPGEGEHKIMEYIRHAKAQKTYQANMRHCLYGLDADLIMLGLLSHDPHFCLLREEVTFGRQAKKSKELEHQNFYLMHLCIVREYLELEFQELKEPGALSFSFDMERIIDDFILMAFFVGNDFLPNLPNLHINEGALALMFKVYKEILPRLDGYLNELGVINLDRLGVMLDGLSDVEYRFFEADVQDAKWFKGKQMERKDVMSKEEKKQKKAQLSITPAQKAIFKQVKKFVNNRTADQPDANLDLASSLPARDRKFVEELADDLYLQWRTVQTDDGTRHLQLNFPEKKAVANAEDDDDDDEEAQLALVRVIKRYENAKVTEESPEELKEAAEKQYEERFRQWKDKYYKGKFERGLESDEGIRKLTENYVQGLQWVLYYYYQGVASWPWFFQFHYSPMISDVKKGLGADMKFQLGQPFRPFQQLMGVLPDRSKKIVPQPYHDLMTNPESSIIDFYPRDFELDMNGKKMEWEAVVNIPFIEEKRLLNAMATKDHLLSDEERARNEFGVSLKFTYSADQDYTYPSSLIGIFPDLANCHCVMNIYDLPTMEGLEVYVGLVEGVKLGVSALAGFPSLKTIPCHAALDFHSVNVFQQDSRNESMVVSVLDPESRTNVEYSKGLLGQRVHVGYPFLSEALVVRISDELFDYTLSRDGKGAPVQTPHGPLDIEEYRKKATQIQRVYSKRLGIIIGDVESLVHVETLKGLRKQDDGAVVKEFGVMPGIETDFAAQMVVDEVESEDQRFLEKAALPIEEEFPVGTKAFCLGVFGFGRPLQVINHGNNKAEVWISILSGKEPDFATPILKDAERVSPYSPSFAVARMLQLHPLTLSKITASFTVDLFGLRVNLGLNLKFEAKKMKVLGYSRRGESGWEFSQKAIELIQQYMIKFPQFIARIQQYPKGDGFAATDFYPEDQAMTKIKEIQAWLKTIESKSFEKVPLDAEQLDSEVVMKIERAADDYAQKEPAPTMKKMAGVPRNALLKPSDAEQRLGNQRFTIGDRIMYTQDSGKVPIAARGTVVGLTRTARHTLLDVVFDVPFMSGTSLNDRCSPFRGSTIPSASVLNLSNRQLEVGSRASDARRPNPNPRAAASNGYGMPVGPGGRGQLVPAHAPPPLRGSFHGVVAGMPNGRRGGARGRGAPNGVPNGNAETLPVRMHPGNAVRGRGNGPMRGQRGGTPPLNRQGYTSFDHAPDAGIVQSNPHFRPKQQHSVPPPASLDATPRARGGRGAGRGGTTRGDRGRARGKGSGAVEVQQ